MTLPSVCILLLTYEDGQRLTAERTLRGLLDHIRYEGDIHVHIADDGSVEGHVERLREIAAGYAHVRTVGSTDARRGGYGASYNLASQTVHASHPIIMPVEDDWELTRDLDITPLVRTLTDTDIQCIRLGYLGFTQPIRGEIVHTPAGPMVALDPASPERHVAAGHPRIETRAWQRAVGPWAERIQAGATEFDWCGRMAARTGVAWPLDYTTASQRSDSLFTHIGNHALGELQPG